MYLKGLNFGSFVFFSFLVFTACSVTGSNAFRGERVQSNSKEARLRAEIVDYAEQYVGLKYKYAGREPKTGFHCSGFTCYVLGHFDIAMSPSSRDQANQGKKIDVEDTQPGDLIFFWRSKGGRIFHVAMVHSNEGDDVIKIIHSTNRGVVIDDLMRNSYWSPKIAYAKRVID